MEHVASHPWRRTQAAHPKLRSNPSRDTRAKLFEQSEANHLLQMFNRDGQPLHESRAENGALGLLELRLVQHACRTETERPVASSQHVFSLGFGVKDAVEDAPGSRLA